MATEWTLDDELWTQNADGEFAPKAIAGAAVRPEVDPVFALGARAAPDGRGFLPRKFQFCPRTGEKLRDCAASGFDWLPPAGNGSAWRVLESEPRAASGPAHILNKLLQAWESGLSTMESSKQSVLPPKQNGLVYMVANLGGYRDALFALSRAGDLYLHEGGSAKWLQILPEGKPLGRSSAEAFGWAVQVMPGLHGSDLLVSLQGAVARVRVNPATLRYSVDSMECEALAAPAVIGGIPVVPFLESGKIFAATPRPEGGWLRTEICIAPRSAEAKFAAPVNDLSSNECFWIGEQGYLTIIQSGATTSGGFHAWPDETFAKPAFGPPFRDGEGWWQLLYEPPGEGRFHEGRFYYSRLGRALDGRRPVTGSRLGTGHLSYQFNVRLEQPWAEFDAELQSLTHVVYPFIEFIPQDILLSFRAVKPRGSLLAFFESSVRTDVAYRVERIGGFSQSLPLAVTKPWEAQWFFFDDALWLAVDSQGALFRWAA